MLKEVEPYDMDTNRVIEYMNNGWGFWDETWIDFHGGYATEAEANAALRHYCTHYLGN
jgi:S-formylglutathione hydrolase FrmB